jgi:hypothetical protein
VAAARSRRSQSAPFSATTASRSSWTVVTVTPRLSTSLLRSCPGGAGVLSAPLRYGVGGVGTPAAAKE